MIDIEKLKLSQTMRDGLVRMAAKQREMANVIAVWPHPNNGTARALAKRGLVEPTMKSAGWQLYTVTDLGLQVADALKETSNLAQVSKEFGCA